MIYLQEQCPPYKLPGRTSFFITFNYNADIVSTIKKIPNAVYHKKLTTWEIPATSLAKAIQYLYNIDEITIRFIKESPGIPKKEIKLNYNTYKTMPFKYQEEGIIFGLSRDKCLLLDAPGLGKTLQTTLIAQERKQRGLINHCLIICGLNSLKFNWKNEIETHSDLSCRILGQRINRKGNLVIGSIKDRLEELKNPIDEFFVITNVETLRDDKIIKELKSNKNNKFDMLVADEIHKMKSPTSQQGKNFLKLDSKYKIGLTGTLLLSSPFDSYVPLKWIDATNATYTNFKYYYGVFYGEFNNILSGYRNLEVLQDNISQVSLRRTKEVLNLPPKVIEHEFIEMNPKQKKLYEDVVNGCKESIDKINLNKANLLSLVTRLRQVTADPNIISSEDISSSKLERAVDLATQIAENGDKVIIYSLFKSPLDKVMKELAKYNPLLCTGDIKDSIIEDNKYKFQTDSKYKVLCCTIDKMGTGHTLTAANYEIFMDSTWTFGDNEQAEDRAHRIGTTDTVFIKYLWTKDTFDERVKDIVNQKEAMSDFMVDGEISPKGLSLLRNFVLDL